MGCAPTTYQLIGGSKMIEEWKDIKGYEGLYRVSNYGEVFSVRNSQNLVKRKHTGGYVQFVLSIKGKQQYLFAHRLVAMHFIDNPNKLPQVNHIDEDKKNNFVENLEWCTSEYNNNYGTKIDRITKNLGYRKHREKMKRKVVATCVETGKEILYDSIIAAVEQGFTGTTISAVCRGKHNTHRGYEWRYAN